MKRENFYITTTIPYANAPPHIGFALEIVQADVIARWHRLLGEDVFFLTGTDEHGVKNYQTAKKEGLTPQKFVDKNAALFRELIKKLNISNDNFIRTTDKKNHWPGVVNIWKALEGKGDIYKKKYEGFYCSGCERFITEKELVDGKCVNHPNLEIQKLSEENYFFRLSKYSNKIKKLIEADKLKISPKKWKNDFLGLIRDGLTDVSFSRDRKHLPWGVPVPGDEKQVMYVWPDALTNYLTGIGFPDKKYGKYWPADIHVVGKDMLRFHTGIWPGMLLSAGLSLPKEVIVHGFLTVGGRKMSKSLGNVISPLELVKSYPADSIRYTLMRETPFGDDGDFSTEALVNRHNNELMNKLGNLVSRVSALVEKYGLEKTESKLRKKLKLKEIVVNMERYELDKALNLIFAFIDKSNEYIQDKKPWASGDKKVLYELVDAIKISAILLSPFIPETSEKIAKSFGFKIDYKNIGESLKYGKIKKGDHLFKRVEEGAEPLSKPKESSKEKKEESNKKEVEGVIDMKTIGYDDFAKLELKTGVIKKVEEIKGADKLLKLSVDTGETRTILAGIKEFYDKKDLKGRQIIVVCNLEPRKMRGEMSEGMLLAADVDGKPFLLQPDAKVPAGSKIK